MSKVTNMEAMFFYWPNLQSVTGDPDTSHVSEVSQMFCHDSCLSDVSALSNLDATRAKVMNSLMFYDSGIHKNNVPTNLRKAFV